MSAEDTRRRILAAAAAEFGDKGYSGATTRAIARRAGVNEVTLFRHFGSKHDLLDGIVAEVPDRTSLEDALSAGLVGPPPGEALLGLARRWAAAMQPRAAWLRLQFAERQRPGALQRGQGIGLRRRLADYIRLQQTSGIFRLAVDPDVAAEVFFVGIAGQVIARELLLTDEASRPSPTDAYLQTFVGLFVQGLEVH